VVHESVNDDDRREDAFGLLMSLNMMIETPGGYDFAAAERIGWMKQDGFTDTRVQQLHGPDSIVVGRKIIKSR
jgi:hypothetical protein